MPLYEYRCNQCGYRFEKIQKFNSAQEKVCPKCGGELFRPLTAPALQFKGAGWYVNDYAPKGASSPAAEKPAAEAGKPAATESKSAESKPAAESSPKPAASPGSSTTT